MRTSLNVLTCVSLMLFAASTSYAAGQANLDPRMACREDARTLCKDVRPGDGRIKDCLEDHYKDVSDDCYAALQESAKHPGPPPSQQSAHSGQKGGAMQAPSGDSDQGDDAPN